MDTDSNKVTWVVIIVAAVAIMGGLFVKFVPNIDSQMQGYVQTVTDNFRGGIDSSSKSDFSYSKPNTADDTISIEGYSGHKENLIIPQYRRIGLVYYKITAISHDAFRGNKSIKQLTIGDGLRTIGSGAFQNDSNLKYLTLGSDVTSIGNWSFEHTALTRVDFPASVKSVDTWAFNATPISAISFRNRVDLGWGSFTHTNLKNVTLPTGSTYHIDPDTNTQMYPTFEANVKVTVK